MAIAPICCRCHGELQEPGGLLFSPPTDDDWTVKKDHLCVACYRAVIESIGCEPTLTEFDPDWVVPTRDVLREWLEDCGLSTHVACASRYEKGEARDWAAAVLDRILADEPLNAAMVEVVSAVTGISQDFWRNFEHNYRTGLAAGKKVL